MKKQGQSMTEWGTAVLLITVVTMVTLISIAPRMSNILSALSDALDLNLGQSQQQSK